MIPLILQIFTKLHHRQPVNSTELTQNSDPVKRNFLIYQM